MHSEESWLGPRIGLIVPRFKHSAVARNQIKRRLRELARLQMLPLSISVDIVLRIRPEAYDASFTALAVDITRALTQLTRWHEMRETAESKSESAPDRVNNHQ